jgi:hypothetical protein
MRPGCDLQLAATVCGDMRRCGHLRPARRRFPCTRPSLHTLAYRRLTRPRGFEPLTFGSVDRRFREENGSTKPNPRPGCARNAPEIDIVTSSTGASCLSGGDARSSRRAGIRPAASETTAVRSGTASLPLATSGEVGSSGRTPASVGSRCSDRRSSARSGSSQTAVIRGADAASARPSKETPHRLRAHGG